MNYKSKKITDDIYWVGVIDYELKVFDIIMETEFGSTYNSYIIKGSEKTVLIDTAKATFKEEYFERIKDVCAIEEVDYLVMNHTEPDHSGLIKDLLEINPNIEIYASAPALMNLKEILNMPFKGNRFTNGMTLSLGNKTLEFFIQPNLHWPDTIFTNVKEDNFLFTCDFFGAHYASEEILLKDCKNKEDYMRALNEYFEAIMHPFLPNVIKGLERVKSLNPKYIAVSHGLVLDGPLLEEVVNLYDKISELPKKLDKPLVLIPFASAYGYTQKMAEIIKETIEEELNNEVYIKTFDLIFADLQEIKKLVPICDAFLVGSSTIVRDTVKVVWELLAEIDYEMAKGKVASAFGSYGWSGEAVPNIIQREKQLMFNVVDGLRIKFDPSPEQIEEIKEYAKIIASEIKK
ncbi:MAG: FprA family A-type flavoprotein [Tenericutes bacterium]|nr:FprA family A-type flavoprotein [Mycoplasmatota bacterium]